jgi:hypothetical protein
MYLKKQVFFFFLLIKGIGDKQPGKKKTSHNKKGFKNKMIEDATECKNVFI